MNRCGDRDRINKRIEIESVGDRHGDRGKIDRGIDMVIAVHQVCTKCAPGVHQDSCSPGVHQVCYCLLC